MRAIFFVVLCALAGLLVLGAGCTQPSTGPATQVQTPVPTTAQPTASPTVATPVATPTLGYIEGPLPAQYMVDVQVDRNTVAITPSIIATYRGGKGTNFVYSVDVTVTRSDGQVITKSLERPQVNQQVEIEGTRGTDRVEVFVNLVNGERYRIYDQSLAFRTYN
ncbi:MAG TPA: hypothetical protein HA264_02330 [Methanolinea sp.]|jgi:hypothetical protein|nr:MAG: hypothetical protein A4E36_00541 [Methanoregulaceae archaeon PtaB.Bin009]OPY41487.1 MAG: hypothetical protein A4E41_00912 [Methanoregulaceae archaeon PtaU1.Bin066]HII75889.1 hypothetical protein [Methanolinea sp.]HNQ29935.1 hypothetical protein [Methanolinea sp.]